MTGILIFGAPGMGKSSLIESIQELTSLGILELPNPRITVIDLETLPSHDARIEWLATHDYFIAGAADITPAEAKLIQRFAKPGSKLLRFLIHMPQAEYELRRARRDAAYPSKATQGTHNVWDWIREAGWDVILHGERPIPHNAMRVLSEWRGRLVRPSRIPNSDAVERCTTAPRNSNRK